MIGQAIGYLLLSTAPPSYAYWHAASLVGPLSPAAFRIAPMLLLRSGDDVMLPSFGIDAAKRRMIVHDWAAAQLPCVFFAAGFGLPFGIRWVDGSKVPLRPSPLTPVSPPRPMRVLTRFGHSTADRGNGPQCARLGLSVATRGDPSQWPVLQHPKRRLSRTARSASQGIISGMARTCRTRADE